jgi:putative membrane protein
VKALIDYDRTSWWQTCLSVYGSVLPYVLGRVGILTGFALALCLLNAYVLEPGGYEIPAMDELGHSVLGVALSLLIVFRTNAANSRYWEGRALWGTLVNQSRNLARLGAVYAGPAAELARLISAYVLALRYHLCDDPDLSAVRPLLTGWLYDRIRAAPNPPALLSRSLSEWVRQRRDAGKLDPLMALEMERLIGELVSAQGGCERIHRTPLPFVYAAMIKLLLLVYLGTLPFVLVGRMGFAAPLVVAVVSLAMLGIEEAGVEIEDPFGRDPNHLPLDAICAAISRDVTLLSEEPPR